MSVCPVAAELVENPYHVDLSAFGSDRYFVTDEYSVSEDVVYHVDEEYVTPADAYTGEPTEYIADIDDYIITPPVNEYPYWSFLGASFATVMPSICCKGICQ